MTQRARKLIGTFGTVAFLIAYALLAMAVGAELVIGRGPAFELPFYVFAGIAWLPAVMGLIRWMSRPDSA
jgi:hypothetical protein